VGTVARVTEISSTSEKSFDDAIAVGITRADETLRKIRAAWVKEQEVHVVDGRVAEYQVNMLVTFMQQLRRTWGHSAAEPNVPHMAKEVTSQTSTEHPSRLRRTVHGVIDEVSHLHNREPDPRPAAPWVFGIR
jgi:dodecin